MWAFGPSLDRHLFTDAPTATLWQRGAAAADQFVVEIPESFSFGEASTFEEAMRATLGDEPFKVLSDTQPFRVRLSAAGVQKLAESGAVPAINVVSTEREDEARKSGSVRYVEWHFEFRAEEVAAGPNVFLTRDEAADAKWNVKVLQKKKLELRGLTERLDRERHFVVVALSRSGEEISRYALVDPRLVRSETINEKKQFTGHREFIRPHVRFGALLKDHKDISRIQFETRTNGKEPKTDILHVLEIAPEK